MRIRTRVAVTVGRTSEPKSLPMTRRASQAVLLSVSFLLAVAHLVRAAEVESRETLFQSAEYRLMGTSVTVKEALWHHFWPGEPARPRASRS
jgi:hypothetical protein